MLRQANLIDNKIIPILYGDINSYSTELNYRELDDQKLASLYVNNRDDYAYNEIVNRFGEKIFRLAMRITKNPESAEEVLQNVFLKLIEKLGTFREESKLSTWIYTVSSNEALMYLKNKNKNNSKEISVEKFTDKEKGYNPEGLQMKDNSYGPDDTVINIQHGEIMEKAINELTEKYRIVFQLRDVEGLSNQEAANISSLSLSAVKSRILRARNQLKKKLARYFPEFKGQ